MVTFMKKKLFAMFCALALLVSALPCAGALEGEAARAADTLAALNLVKGTGSGYALDEPATRAQAAVLLVRLAGAEQEATSSGSRSSFRDAPAWCRSYITYAASQKWIYGVTAQAFRPDETVTANAWCTFLLRMLGYSDHDGDFTVGRAALFAQRIGLISRSYDGPLTRGDLFQIMRDALTFSYKNGSATVIQRLIQRGACSQSAASALGLLSQELTARQVADRYMSAVFCLDVYEKETQIESSKPSGNASGFFISADGLAITNYHSIDDAIYATATLSTGEVYPVESVIYYDVDIDIAVLRISRTSSAGKTTSAFSTLELVGTEGLRAGDVVYTLGNPLGLGLAVSSGIVSATERDVDRYALPCVMNTADISKGSSGGALLNVYGQVVAVTAGAYTYGNNMYLAVPVDPVMEADLTVEGMTLPEVVEAVDAAEAAEEEAS